VTDSLWRRLSSSRTPRRRPALWGRSRAISWPSPDGLASWFPTAPLRSCASTLLLATCVAASSSRIRHGFYGSRSGRILQAVPTRTRSCVEQNSVLDSYCVFWPLRCPTIDTDDCYWPSIIVRTPLVGNAARNKYGWVAVNSRKSDSRAYCAAVCALSRSFQLGMITYLI
jgi:hypothetical protein